MTIGRHPPALEQHERVTGLRRDHASPLRTRPPLLHDPARRTAWRRARGAPAIAACHPSRRPAFRAARRRVRLVVAGNRLAPLSSGRSSPPRAPDGRRHVSWVHPLCCAMAPAASARDRAAARSPFSSAWASAANCTRNCPSGVDTPPARDSSSVAADISRSAATVRTRFGTASASPVEGWRLEWIDDGNAHFGRQSVDKGAEPALPLCFILDDRRRQEQRQLFDQIAVMGVERRACFDEGGQTMAPFRRRGGPGIVYAHSRGVRVWHPRTVHERDLRSVSPYDTTSSNGSTNVTNMIRNLAGSVVLLGLNECFDDAQLVGTNQPTQQSRVVVGRELVPLVRSTGRGVGRSHSWVRPWPQFNLMVEPMTVTSAPLVILMPAGPISIDEPEALMVMALDVISTTDPATEASGWHRSYTCQHRWRECRWCWSHSGLSRLSPTWCACRSLSRCADRRP